MVSLEAVCVHKVTVLQNIRVHFQVAASTFQFHIPALMAMLPFNQPKTYKGCRCLKPVTCSLSKELEKHTK